MLSVSAKVIYLVPPNYRVSDLDFLQIKDHDDVSLVRWQGEQWLASITQRPIDRYTKFWGSEFISSQVCNYPSNTLSTVQSINQSINQTNNQWNNQSNNQSIKQSIQLCYFQLFRIIGNLKYFWDSTESYFIRIITFTVMLTSILLPIATG